MSVRPLFAFFSGVSLGIDPVDERLGITQSFDFDPGPDALFYLGIFGTSGLLVMEKERTR